MESDTDAVRVAAVDNIAVAMHTLNSIVSVSEMSRRRCVSQPWRD